MNSQPCVMSHECQAVAMTSTSATAPTPPTPPTPRRPPTNKTAPRGPSGCAAPSPPPPSPRPPSIPRTPTSVPLPSHPRGSRCTLVPLGRPCAHVTRSPPSASYPPPVPPPPPPSPPPPPPPTNPAVTLHLLTSHSLLLFLSVSPPVSSHRRAGVCTGWIERRRLHRPSRRGRARRVDRGWGQRYNTCRGWSWIGGGCHVCAGIDDGGCQLVGTCGRRCCRSVGASGWTNIGRSCQGHGGDGGRICGGPRSTE